MAPSAARQWRRLPGLRALAAVLIVALASHSFAQAAAQPNSPRSAFVESLVLLGAPSERRCLGAKISGDKSVFAPAHCTSLAYTYIETASFGFSIEPDAQVGVFIEQERLQIERQMYHSAFNASSASQVDPASTVGFDVAVLELMNYPVSAQFRGIELFDSSIEDVRRGVDAVRIRLEVIRVNRATLGIKWQDDIVLVDNRECGIEPADDNDSADISKTQVVCIHAAAQSSSNARPIRVAEHDDDVKDYWSLLVSVRAGDTVEFELLGFESSHRVDSESFQSFTWIAATLNAKHEFIPVLSSASAPSNKTVTPTLVPAGPSEPPLPPGPPSGGSGGAGTRVPVTSEPKINDDAGDHNLPQKYSAFVRSLAVLGSPSDPRACLAVVIDSNNLLAPAYCAYDVSPEPLAWASFGFSIKSEKTRIGTFSETQRVEIEYVTYDKGLDPLKNDWAFVTLTSDPEILPVSFLDEDIAAVRDGSLATFGLGVIRVDKDTLEVSWSEGVKIVDSSDCGIAADGSEDPYLACTTSAPHSHENQSTIADDTDTNAWSVLLYSHTIEPEEPTTSLVGFGSQLAAHQHFESFTWAAASDVIFTSWLSRITRFQFPDNLEVPELASDLKFIAGLRDSRKGSNYCGAVMITPMAALTAAHCIRDDDQAPQWVSMGTLATKGSKRGNQTKSFFTRVHPDYDPETRENDFAVLLLNYDSAEFATLFNSQPIPSVAQLFSYESKASDGRVKPEVLQLVDVDIVASNGECSADLGYTIANSSFCAADRGSEDACSRDSRGEPVIVRDENGRVSVLGLTSNDRGCRSAGTPGVYANASSAQDFIARAAAGYAISWTSPPTPPDSGSSSSSGSQAAPGGQGHDHSATAHSLAILGSRNIPRACLVVLVEAEYALAPALCARQVEGPEAWVEFGFDTVKGTTVGSFNATERIPVLNITIHSEFSQPLLGNASETSSVMNDWALIHLARASFNAKLRVINLLDEYASLIESNSRNSAVVDILRVNRETLDLTWVEGVVLEDNTGACGLEVENPTQEDTPVVCAQLPSPNSRREATSTVDGDYWSLIVYYEMLESGESVKHFLGFKSSHMDVDNYLSFTWAESAGPEFIGKPQVPDAKWSLLSDVSGRSPVEVLKPDMQFITGIRQTRKGTNYCGGSLISPTFVLTAAHCAVDGTANWVSIGSLLQNGSTMGEQIRVERTVVHPGFDAVVMANDLALLELKYPSVVIPVPVFNSQPFPSSGQIFGYGALNIVGQPQADVLHVVGLNVLPSNDICMQTLQLDIDPSMFCALSPTGKQEDDACLGDSGGPLVVKDVDDKVALLGLVSYGRGCGLSGIPGVYANVSTGVAFIQDSVFGVKWTSPVPSATPSPPMQSPAPRDNGRFKAPSPAASPVPSPGSSKDALTPSTPVPTRPSFGIVDHSSGNPTINQLVIAPATLSSGVQNALIDFLVGTTANIDNSHTKELFRGSELVFQSSRSLEGIEALIGKYNSKPLHQRKTRFAAGTEHQC